MSSQEKKEEIFRKSLTMSRQVMLFNLVGRERERRRHNIGLPFFPLPATINGGKKENIVPLFPFSDAYHLFPRGAGVLPSLCGPRKKEGRVDNDAKRDHSGYRKLPSPPAVCFLSMREGSQRVSGGYLSPFRPQSIEREKPALKSKRECFRCYLASLNFFSDHSTVLYCAYIQLQRLMTTHFPKMIDHTKCFPHTNKFLSRTFTPFSHSDISTGRCLSVSPHVRGPF